MATRTITLAAARNIDGVLWPAATYNLDDSWSERFLASGATEPAAPAVVRNVGGPGYVLAGEVGKKVYPHARTLSLPSPVKRHGVTWPSGTNVIRDHAWAEELLTVAGVTETPPTAVRVAGGWSLA